MNKSVSLFTLAVLATVTLIGCSSKEEDAKANAPASSAAAPQVEAKPAPVVEASQKDNMLKPDASVSWDKYVELDGGRHLYMSFMALGNQTPDYEKIASIISKDFENERDGFKRKEKLDRLKVKIDEEIANAKDKRYFYSIMQQKLNGYDFNEKSFVLDDMSPKRSSRGYGIGFTEIGFHGYSVDLLNYKDFSSFVVEDETLARKIENFRAKQTGSYVDVKVYFFVGGVDVDGKKLKAQITRIEMLDGKDKVLLSR